mmetsp:Transcript_3666/g.7222  ORF Transcript_3666/g.7222 Transcript_3666/m.7222 type:complete len:110 (+) Transcript_3666:900-1229(+)
MELETAVLSHPRPRERLGATTDCFLNHCLCNTVRFKRLSQQPVEGQTTHGRVRPVPCPVLRLRPQAWRWPAVAACSLLAPKQHDQIWNEFGNITPIKITDQSSKDLSMS